MLDVFLDALLDSLKIALVVLILNILLSFFEVKLAHLLNKNPKISPVIGSLCGIIPECGISVGASDLYIKNNITVGTLVAIFISCSDEALPLLIGSMNKKALYAIPLILIKIIVGIISGIIIDLIIKNHVENITIEDDNKTTDICSVHVHAHKHNSKLDKHLWHPLLHTLKLLIYVFVINFIFGIVAYYYSSNIESFLSSNKYLSPLVASIIGMIPNCASSVLITELFVNSSIGFGALVSGLMINAGLGFMILFKNKKTFKKAWLILLVCFVLSVLTGYIVSLICGF